jgi:hypothetical protein
MSRQLQPLPATPDLGPARVFDKRRLLLKTNSVIWEPVPLVVSLSLTSIPAHHELLSFRLGLERWILTTSDFVPVLTLRLYMDQQTYQPIRHLLMAMFKRFSPRLELWVLPNATARQVEAVARTQPIFDRSVSCACIRRLQQLPSVSDLAEMHKFVSSKFRLAVLVGDSIFLDPMVKGNPKFRTPWSLDRLPENDDQLLEEIMQANPELARGPMARLNT